MVSKICHLLSTFALMIQLNFLLALRALPLDNRLELFVTKAHHLWLLLLQ